MKLNSRVIKTEEEKCIFIKVKKYKYIKTNIIEKMKIDLFIKTMINKDKILKINIL